MNRYKLIIPAILIPISILSLWFATYIDMLPVPSSLSHQVIRPENTAHPLLLDRNRVPLNTTYVTKWNQSNIIHLHEIPELIQKIFILSEDRNFYNHSGIDWPARIHALIQNIIAGRAVRGASTITEQVVRMIHPRKRTIWSRWLEGFEARKLEKSNSKSDILEFYLNQVPYASNRRGVVQAASFYFDRSIETLSLKEILAIATLVRAPSAYDLYKHPGKIDHPLDRLAQRAISADLLTETFWNQIRDLPFSLKRSALYVEAPHFIRHVYNNIESPHFRGKTDIITTLDGILQNKAQSILTTTLKSLRSHNVTNGAMLITDHGTGEILAWAVASTSTSELRANFGHYAEKNSTSTFDNQTFQFKTKNTRSGTQYIDAVNALRQPGSAMKPFLYALALEKGWSAATMIDDSPLQEPVGVGVHTYHNYSHIHYGPITLRNALGNSLNIPAIKTIRFTGVEAYLEKLKLLGITTLSRHPDFYGDGLALGNGEVSLYDMVQAYSVLANSGRFITLSPFYDFKEKKESRPYKSYPSITPVNSYSEKEPLYPEMATQKNTSSSNLYANSVFSKEVTSIIGNILSDPGARQLEFGGGDLLNFPIQTAVKTGTSSDYRDAWAMGYNSRYTAGVWMGNLNGSSTVELTGSRGPIFVLRSIFAELNNKKVTYYGVDGNRSIYMSPELVQKEICISHTDKGQCVKKTEWFIPGSEIDSAINEHESNDSSLESIRIASERKSPYKKQCYANQESEKYSQIFGFINPVNGLEVAMDPRIPDELEYMEFVVTGVPPGKKVKWMVNEEEVFDRKELKKSTGDELKRLNKKSLKHPNREVLKSSMLANSTYNLSEQGYTQFRSKKSKNTLKWKIQRGYHRVSAELIDNNAKVSSRINVTFLVK
ncbi:MAG: transglycosylase domain-containing protein [Desulfamplus sp.]|nr:transglycosylase domain-containing protein [Desulfamplus sp.]